MSDQFDIFGGTQAPPPEPEGYLARDASVPQGTQSRLFEPQMEGQLYLDSEASRILAARESVLASLPEVTLEMRTPPEGGGRGATTGTEGTAHAGQ